MANISSAAAAQKVYILPRVQKLPSSRCGRNSVPSRRASTAITVRTRVPIASMILRRRLMIARNASALISKRSRGRHVLHDVDVGVLKSVGEPVNATPLIAQAAASSRSARRWDRWRHARKPCRIQNLPSHLLINMGRDFAAKRIGERVVFESAAGRPVWRQISVLRQIGERHWVGTEGQAHEIIKAFFRLAVVTGKAR